MSENSQMVEQIFSNIDSLGGYMESTVDLNKDVAPFMASTLAKIKQLALAKEGNYEDQYELFQIATNYLPRAINGYSALPIEYRNTRVVKSNKTARQLLIEDLKILKTQVLEIEKNFYAGIESQIKVSSNVVREKYDHKFQLATELDQLGEDGFVNQFDYSTYQNSKDYKEITFKREVSEKEIAAKARNEKINQALSKAGDVSLEVGSLVWKKSVPVFKSLSKGMGIFLAGFFSFLGEVLPALIPFGIVIGFVGGIGYLIVSSSKPDYMFNAVNKTSEGIYEVMSINVIPQPEFASFVKAKAESMIDGSSYRKDRVKVTYNEKNRTIEMNISDISKNRCMEFIDHKEEDFDRAEVKVNGMELPQDNIVSDYHYLINANHKMCHLDDGNKITIDFDNQKIHSWVKAPYTDEELKAKLAKVEKELAELQPIAAQYEGSKNYNGISSMLNTLKSQQGKLDNIQKSRVH
jgi:hypothetical protein